MRDELTEGNLIRGERRQGPTAIGDAVDTPEPRRGQETGLGSERVKMSPPLVS